MVNVLVDSRERPSPVYRLLAGVPDVECRIVRLDVGDYLVDGKVLVERKTLDDFAASVVDARIFHQANRLARSPHRALVLLEGRSMQRRLGREQMQGALVALTLVFDLPVLRSSGPEETVWLLRAASRQVQRRVAKGLASRRWNPRDRNARRVHMLTALPGIGPERATRLLARFGSLDETLSATEEEIAAVPGIGRPTARAIRDFLNNRTRR